MGVTQTQLQELINLTLKDMPKTPLEDLLCGVCESEEESSLLLDFIKKNYTKEEILIGLEIYLQRCKWMNDLYGKNSGGKKVRRVCQLT